MLEGHTLWELVEKRAAETPDAPLVVDERGESLTFAEFTARSERTAAGLLAMGVAEGTVVSWQLPSWIESMCSSAALSRHRRRAEPDPPDLSGARGRLHRAPGEVEAPFRAVEVPRVRLRGDGARDRDRRSAGSRSRSATANCPTAIRLRCRPPFLTPAATCRSGGSSTPPARPPTPKARSTPTRRSRRPRAGWRERLGLTADDRHSLVFPFTHIGGVIWLFSALMSGTAQIVDEAFNPETTIPLLQREGVTLAGSGTFFHLAYLQGAAREPGHRRCSRTCALSRAAARRSRRSSTTT